MAWIYLAESEASPLPFRPGSSLGPIVKSTDTRRPFCFHEWQTWNSQSPRSGTMCERYPGACSPLLTSSLADSPVRTSVLLAMGEAWAASVLSFSLRLLDSSVRFDPATCSWKMLQPSLFEGSIASPPNFPRSGMTVGGTCLELAMWERPTKERGGGFWPTPTARDYRSPGVSRSRRALDKHRRSLPLSVVFKERYGYRLPPNFVEYLMGYAQQHTVLEPWAMRWFRGVRGKRLSG